MAQYIDQIHYKPHISTVSFISYFSLAEVEVVDSTQKEVDAISIPTVEVIAYYYDNLIMFRMV